MYEKSRRDTGKWGWKQCEVTTSIVSKFVVSKKHCFKGALNSFNSSGSNG